MFGLMTMHKDIPAGPESRPVSVEEAGAPVFVAKPIRGEPDWEAILDGIERRFPKTLARLAE